MTEALSEELGKFTMFKRELSDASEQAVGSTGFSPVEYNKFKDVVLERMVKFGLIKSKRAGYEEEMQYVSDGGAVSHSRMARGIEKCFMRRKKAYTKTWYRLYVNMSIPASVSDSKITEDAMKVFSLIDALSRIGIEVEVFSVLRSNDGGSGNHISYCHPVKGINDGGRYTPEFYVNQISGRFFRTRGFDAVRKLCEQEHGYEFSGLGQPVKLKEAINLWEFDLNELLGKLADDLQVRQISKLLKD